MGPLNAVNGVTAPTTPVRGPAPPPVFGKPTEGAQDGFFPSPELREDSRPQGSIPAFDFGFTAEEKANPYRQGQDVATTRANRQKDQDLVDHVCGKGCGCSSLKGGADDDPLKTLEARDQEVRQHEQEHLSAAGEHARGGPEFETVTARNGRQYVVGGKVNVDVSETDDPQKTITKMEKIQRAALAPTNPSAQDRKVAAEASDKELQARGKLQATT